MGLLAGLYEKNCISGSTIYFFCWRATPSMTLINYNSYALSGFLNPRGLQVAILAARKGLRVPATSLGDCRCVVCTECCIYYIYIVLQRFAAKNEDLLTRF